MAAGKEEKEKLKERDVVLSFYFIFAPPSSPYPCMLETTRTTTPSTYVSWEREKKEERRREREGKRKGKKGCIRVLSPFASFCPFTSGVPSCCLRYLSSSLFVNKEGSIPRERCGGGREGPS